MECLLTGDVDTGKAVLRNLHQRHNRISGAWRADRQVAQESDAYVQPQRQPQARNLFKIIGYLQKREGLHLKIHTVR